MKIVAPGIAVLFLWFGLVSSRDNSMKFSRTTVKGLVLEREPKGHRQIYKDRFYQFVIADNLGERIGSTFLAHDLVQKRWLLITELSTEHARLGKSFDIPSDATSDFRTLGKVEYAQLPLKARGSNILPDRITFDSRNQLFRMDCNSSLNLPLSLTSFWVRKSDLDAIR